MEHKVEDDYYLNHYKNYIGSLEPYYKREFERYSINFNKYFYNIPKNAKILDIGCGVGAFVEYLRRQNFKNVVGIDSSAQSIQICKNRFQDFSFFNKPAIDYLKTNNNEYSVIGMFSLLEHLEKAELKEIIRIIKSQLMATKGIFIFSTPNMDALFGNTGGRYGDFTHTIGFTKSSINQILVEAGYEQINIFEGHIQTKTFFKHIIRKYYQPVMFKLIQYLFASLDIRYPEIKGSVIYGMAR